MTPHIIVLQSAVAGLLGGSINQLTSASIPPTAFTPDGRRLVVAIKGGPD